MSEQALLKKNIMQAIQNVQQTADLLKRESAGQVGAGKFKYTNLTDTWLSIKQLLKDNGLVVYQTPTDMSAGGHGGNYFRTTIHHIESGEEVTETMMMVLTRQDPQALGAAITFYRRYMITSMLGLIPDDDNDAREHRLATATQKLQIVGAVKMTFPDVVSPAQINETLENIVGKHPSQIREDEADHVIDLVKAYRDDAKGKIVTEQ